MAYEVLDHPEAPSLEEMGEFVVEPVAPDVIRDNRENEGLALVETNLLEHPDIDAYIELGDPNAPANDIGTVLYRLVQIFGTPQLPEYAAGRDISWRSDDTFKYLLRVRRGATEDSPADQADGQWLVTVFDHHVRVGVGLAEWREDPTAELSVDPAEAIPILAVIANGVREPVACEYDDAWY